MVLILDTETTGLPASMDAPYTDTKNWPHMLSIAWQEHYEGGEVVRQSFIISPRPGVVNTQGALAINKITPELQEREGVSVREVLRKLRKAMFWAELTVAHNVQFDKNIIGCEFHRIGEQLPENDWFCTKEDIGNLLQLPPTPTQREYRPEIEYKQPSLNELYQFLFSKPVPGREESHGARQDAAACAECYWELKRRNLI